MKSNILSMEAKRKIIEAVEEAIIECGLQHTFNIMDQEPSTEPYKEQPSKVKISLDFKFDSNHQIVCSPVVDL